MIHVEDRELTIAPLFSLPSPPLRRRFPGSDDADTPNTRKFEGKQEVVTSSELSTKSEEYTKTRTLIFRESKFISNAEKTAREILKMWSSENRTSSEVYSKNIFESLTSSQECELKCNYSMIPFMSSDDLWKLESITGLKSEQIKKWYENKEKNAKSNKRPMKTTTRDFKKSQYSEDVTSFEFDPEDVKVFENLTACQECELKCNYSMIPFMSSDDLAKLTSITDLTSEQIKNWHKYQEQKAKSDKQITTQKIVESSKLQESEDVKSSEIHSEDVKSSEIHQKDAEISQNILTSSQECELKCYYSMIPFMSSDDLEKLASTTELTPFQIKKWHELQEKTAKSNKPFSEIKTREIRKSPVSKYVTPSEFHPEDVKIFENLTSSQKCELKCNYSMIPFMSSCDLWTLASVTGLKSEQIKNWHKYREEQKAGHHKRKLPKSDYVAEESVDVIKRKKIEAFLKQRKQKSDVVKSSESSTRFPKTSSAWELLNIKAPESKNQYSSDPITVLDAQILHFDQKSSEFDKSELPDLKIETSSESQKLEILKPRKESGNVKKLEEQIENLKFQVKKNLMKVGKLEAENRRLLQNVKESVDQKPDSGISHLRLKIKIQEAKHQQILDEKNAKIEELRAQIERLNVFFGRVELQ